MSTRTFHPFHIYWSHTLWETQELVGNPVALQDWARARTQEVGGRQGEEM